MKELLIATGNFGKHTEIVRIFSDLPLKFWSLADLGLGAGGPEENGDTFEKNALIKAQYFAEKAGGMMTLAEDSGIFVKALEGELGLKTRRWGAGEGASDLEWVEYFLKRLEGATDRSAKFVSSACLYDPKLELEEYATSEVLGVITENLMAPICPGLPLTSCFVPEGYDQVYEKLPKNEISHRAKAMQGIRPVLERILS